MNLQGARSRSKILLVNSGRITLEEVQKKLERNATASWLTPSLNLAVHSHYRFWYFIGLTLCRKSRILNKSGKSLTGVLPFIFRCWSPLEFYWLNDNDVAIWLADNTNDTIQFSRPNTLSVATSGYFALGFHRLPCHATPSNVSSLYCPKHSLVKWDVASLSLLLAVSVPAPFCFWAEVALLLPRLCCI